MKQNVLQLRACQCSQRYNTPDRMVLDVTDFRHQTNYAEKGFHRGIYKRAIFKYFRGLKPRYDGFVKVEKFNLTKLMPSYISLVFFFLLIT